MPSSPAPTRPGTPEGPPSAEPCSHCGSPLVGPYCAECGQRARFQRLRLGPVLRDAWVEVSALDRGLLRTLRDLTLRPATVVGDVLRGRTRPYVHPVRYFLLWIAVAQLATLHLGGFFSFASGLARGLSEAGSSHPNVEALALRMAELYVLAAAGLLPVLAVLTYQIFRAGRLTLAEHLVAHGYLAGQMAVWWTLISLNGLLPTSSALIGELITELAAVGWFLWAGGRIFSANRWQGLLGMAVAGLLGLVLYILGWVAVFRLLQVLSG